MSQFEGYNSSEPERPARVRRNCVLAFPVYLTAAFYQRLGDYRRFSVRAVLGTVELLDAMRGIEYFFAVLAFSVFVVGFGASGVILGKMQLSRTKTISGIWARVAGLIVIALGVGLVTYYAGLMPS